MFSKPVVFSRGAPTFRGFMPEVEIMLPEYLKGKLSLEMWKVLITMHLVRFKAYNSGRMSKTLGATMLIILGAFSPALIISGITGGPLGFLLLFPISGFLLGLLYARTRLRRWEFELDREVAGKLGTEAVLQVLEAMKSLDPRASPSTSFARFLAYWNPSIDDRVSELGKSRPITRHRSWIPKVGFRWRGIMVGIGFAIFWSSGFVANLVYGQRRTSFACTSNGCAALVISAAVGYWLAILAGISLVIGVIQHVRQARRATNLI